MSNQSYQPPRLKPIIPLRSVMAPRTSPKLPAQMTRHPALTPAIAPPAPPLVKEKSIYNAELEERYRPHELESDREAPRPPTQGWSIFKALEFPGGPEIQPSATALYNALVMSNRLAWMNLLATQPLVTGKFATSMTGERIGAVDNYIELFTNKAAHPVAVRVLGSFSGIPGKQVKLALTPDSQDSSVVDYLGNTASAPSFNKRLTDSIVLMPNETIYINTVDPMFNLVLTDIFRVRLLDPAAIVANPSWEVR
jgi:hypothetical protein